MLECTTPDYELLYARWLQNPEDLLLRANLVPGEHVLDLCGATGAVAFAALARGAGSATVFDLNPRCHCPAVVRVQGDVNKGQLALLETLGPKFDVVVCRQAIGYLRLDRLAVDVPPLLSKGGRFAFNTFKKPKWSFQYYRFGGHRYWEASAFLGKTVFHLQSMIGAFDVTKFHWYSKREILSVLRPSFSDVQVTETATSLHFVCVKN